MRHRKSCNNCRQLHLKCVVEASGTVCQRCLESRWNCHFVSKFRFKQVLSVDSGTHGQGDLTHDDGQVWVPSTRPVQFVTDQVAGFDADQSPAADSTSELRSTSETYHEVGLDSSTSPTATHAAHIRPAQWQSSVQGWEPQQSSVRTSLIPDIASPASISELTRRHESTFATSPAWTNPSPAAEPATVVSPGLSVQRAPPAIHELSHWEALLVQHYVEKITPWIDACDLSHQFALELPKRAMRRPMLLYSILALSSRHQALLQKQDEHEASFYHGQCLQRVIEALSLDMSYDEELLATVALLRVYEEVEATTDTFLHHSGIRRLLAAMPTFANSGGLAEAACWLSLRQEIFVSLVNREPPSLYLSDYDQSSAHGMLDDGACANIITLLFAKVLTAIWSPTPDSQNIQQLERGIKTWDDRRQSLFQPIFYQGVDLRNNVLFPRMCLVNASQGKSLIIL